MAIIGVTTIRDDQASSPSRMPGGAPVHVDPYHKLKWGWSNPQLADHSGRYTLRQARHDGRRPHPLQPYFGTSEFFILENRWRGNSFDRFRDNSWQEGLALWHCIQDPQLARTGAGVRSISGEPIRGSGPTGRSKSPRPVRWEGPRPPGYRPPRRIPAADPALPRWDAQSHPDQEYLARRPHDDGGRGCPPARGEIVGVEGLIRMIRIHEHGTGDGPPAHQLNEDCIITLENCGPGRRSASTSPGRMPRRGGACSIGCDRPSRVVGPSKSSMRRRVRSADECSESSTLDSGHSRSRSMRGLPEPQPFGTSRAKLIGRSVFERGVRSWRSSK